VKEKTEQEILEELMEDYPIETEHCSVCGKEHPIYVLSIDGRCTDCTSKED
jgi:hypothetical protein